MPPPLLRVMQVLYSCWLLAGEDTDSPAIPSGPGVFDHALKKAYDDGLFPDWVRERLHFVDSHWGLTCLEVADIQRLATEAKITSDPNPTYLRTEIRVGKEVAQHLLSRLGVSEEDAATWGRAFRKALTDAEHTLAASAA